MEMKVVNLIAGSVVWVFALIFFLLAALFGQVPPRSVRDRLVP